MESIRLPPRVPVRDYGNMGLQQCPSGTIMTSMEVRDNRLVEPYITEICGKCSDGTKLACVGRNYGTISKKSTGPYTSIATKTTIDKAGHPNRLVGLQTAGYHSGDQPEASKVKSYTDSCPSGTYINGIYGIFDYMNNDKSQPVISGVGFTCGHKKEEYCLENVDAPGCSDISTVLLNQACKKNMGKLCQLRRSELDDNYMADYCAVHNNEPICACYQTMPTYLPNTLKDRPACWNNTCATQGYIPRASRGAECPNVAICRSDSVDYNLTNNIVLQDCRSELPEHSGSADTTPNDASIPNAEPSDKPTTINNNVLDWLLLLLIFVILAAMAVFLVNRGVLVAGGFDLGHANNYQEL